jgi:folate-dependent phosphoribosylglycinamide formyltransferase PurN
MLILGGDRITQSALNSLELNSESLLVVIDRSTTLKRVIRLIFRKRLSVLLVLKMLICEYKRSNRSVSQSNFSAIKNNKDLLEAIDSYKPEKILLFRAGLVINKEVISRGIPLLNIHCAKVPEYGGLGSIDRALRDNAVEQNATLHQVTTTIDEGIVVEVEPFVLDTKRSYCYNENIAYEAGLKLLFRCVKSSVSG